MSDHTWDRTVPIVSTALGKVDYSMSEKKKNSRISGRSLFVVKDIKAREKLTEGNVRSIRPRNGLDPKFYHDVIRKSSNIGIDRGIPL